MGLLDDAIREHLDLKRRRGADPAEVERAEREALGPVRRNRDPGETADPQDVVPGGGGFAYDQDDDGEWEEAAPAGAGLAEPEAGFEDEPEFDPVQPPEPTGRSSRRPRSLSEPLDGEVAAPHDGEEADLAEPADSAVAPEGDWSAADEGGFDAEPFPTAPASSRQPQEVTGEETREYRVEDAFDDEESGEEGSGEDMLEETPEFLQDTPDHDRLWFEQRPPRDFDFDG
jgi:hypothetical protein